jgi:hypothetical protein
MAIESAARLAASARESPEVRSHSKEDHPQLEEVSDSSEPLVELTEEQRRKVIRRLDWILIPQVTFLYLLAYLDRGNSKLRNPRKLGWVHGLWVILN